MNRLADPAPFYKSLDPLLVWQQLPRPADWSAVFGRRAPLAVEIGIGNGEFLARESTDHPERDHVGIELRWSSVKRALRNLAHARERAGAATAAGDATAAHGRGNVRLVLDDAKPVLERLFAPRSIDRLFVLFPCPWRKEQHERLRLFHRDFCDLVANRLVDGGEALLVTDWTPYAEWTLGQLPGTALAVEHRRIDPSFRTKYERKWLALGRTDFHELRLTKREHRERPTCEEPPLNPPHLPACDLDRLAPENLLPAGDGTLTITFKETVRDRERQVAMIRTVVVEEPLTQMVWITVARDPKDASWWVVPARGCQMIPTAGLQRALERVAEAARRSVTATTA
jgi:tRNA (guanine-N7-)-methyltransferase